jgi:hypothetical protein
MTRCFFHAVLVCAVTLAVGGCSNKENGGSPSPVASVDPSIAGSITGTVTLEGPPPALKPIDMSASPACAQANPTPAFPQTVVTGPNGALSDVVVYVKSGLGNYRYDTPTETAILGQKNCMYSPPVLALMTNQPFAVQNNDPTMHNVHPMPKHNRQWSNSQPSGSAPLKQSFANPEFAMPVLCNVHPWMRAIVFVFDHPYFMVTTKTGAFELKNLPPGSYTIEAWHGSYAPQDQAVTIAPRESKSISFVFKSSM